MNPADLNSCILAREDNRPTGVSPDVSVVIATYNRGDAVLDLLTSLTRQSHPVLDMIVIDNGRTTPVAVERIRASHALYVASRVNSLSLARNIGTMFARSDIVVFLDDDCIAHEDLVGAHLKRYTNREIHGVRGRALPKRHSFYAHFQSHYDLGAMSVPALLDLPGNSSVRRETLISIGGFDADLFGAEDLDLCYKILKMTGNPSSLVYAPDALIYHDYAESLSDYLEKCYRHARMRALLRRKRPDIFECTSHYGPYDKPVQSYHTVLQRLASAFIGRLGTAAEAFGKMVAR